MSGLGKGEDFVPKHRPLFVGNDKISHIFFVLFVIPFLVLRITARFCLQKYGEFVILQSSREQQGNIGKLKEKLTHFIGSRLRILTLFSSFTVRLAQR